MALVYMHRYRPDLLALIRTGYIHPQQERYRNRLMWIADQMEVSDSRDRARLAKEQKRVSNQAAELVSYEERVHHLADQMIEIDLDDGVRVNYAKFQDVLAKIK